jgi:hypothetical protein
MDPYLEDPTMWRGVHSFLITSLVTTINSLVPPRYVAKIEERVYVILPPHDIYPDIEIMRRPRRRRQGGTAGGAVAVASDPPHIIEQMPAEVREAFIEVVRVGKPGQVVTTVEVLSPTNKDPSIPGRGLYLKKQRELLASPVHLLEIDLLRKGRYTVAAPRAELASFGHWDYLVCLHRGRQEGRFETWPFTLRDRLPRVRVPLADRDPDVVVDLQEILDRSYDQGAFGRDIDYRQDPVVPLRGTDAAWANVLLQGKGLRPKKQREKNR